MDFLPSSFVWGLFCTMALADDLSSSLIYRHVLEVLAGID